MSVAATQPGCDPIPRNPLRALRSPYLWLATVHLATDVLVGVAGAGLLALLLLAASSWPIALIGLPVWLLTARLALAASRLERARFRLTLGLEIPPLPPVPLRTESLPRHAAALAASRIVWQQLAYFLLRIPMAALSAAGLLAAWSVPAALILLPLYLHGDADRALWIAVPALLFVVVVAPNLIRALSRLDAALARALLGPSVTGRLTERVGVLETSRRRVVDSAEQERRRIERDLHDGAQQRLVGLAITLGRARTRLGDGADAATRELIDEAHREAKQAITELRDLTRGLHPPVLTGRGLDAALSAVAARSPIPVRVEVHALPRPSATVEAIAYFVVTEALTNVAKHARANRASVSIRRDGDLLRVAVRDDGVGGADPARGTGLAGLADRCAGIDGRFTVDSPPGGPTVLTVGLPCGS